MVDPLKHRANQLFPGIAIAGLVAISAQFLNEHYGAPAMLMAILLGMPLHFLSEEQKNAEGYCVLSAHAACVSALRFWVCASA